MILDILSNKRILNETKDFNISFNSAKPFKHLIIECSTTDESESIRLSKLIKKKSASYIEAPLTGGEWRSKKGNISILVSGKYNSYVRALPVLKKIGYQIIFLGEKLGNASTIKVLTNYLASINLLAIGEVFMICKKYKLDLSKAYQAIRISSGNSFVHTSEGQLILSRSMDAQFTMDLICKDLDLVEKLRKKFNIPSKLIPLVRDTFIKGKKTLGDKEFSTAIVKILEKKCNDKLYAKGFPNKLIDENAILESLISFKRAGANAIISYYADRISKILK